MITETLEIAIELRVEPLIAEPAQCVPGGMRGPPVEPRE